MKQALATAQTCNSMWANYIRTKGEGKEMHQKQKGK